MLPPSPTRPNTELRALRLCCLKTDSDSGLGKELVWGLCSHTPAEAEAKANISPEQVFLLRGILFPLRAIQANRPRVPHANCKTGNAGMRLMAFLCNKGLPAKQQNSICKPRHPGLRPHPPGGVDSGSSNPIMYARSSSWAQVIIH